MFYTTTGNGQAQETPRLLDATGSVQEWWKTTFLDVPTHVTSELMRFAARRCEAQAEFVLGLNRCKTIPDLVNAQTTFLREAVDDFSTEPGRMLECLRSETAVLRPGWTLVRP
jgi:hypothetical protein